MGKRDGRKASGNTEIAHKINKSQIIKPQKTISLNNIKKLDWIKNEFDSRTDHEQALLNEDIKINGLKTPITLSKVGDDEFCLIDGFGRYKAYDSLGKTKIAYEIKNLNIEGDEKATKANVKDFMYYRQLGRRNLTPQAKAKIIGSLPKSKSIANLAIELDKSKSYIEQCRQYCRAIKILEAHKVKDISELSITQAIAKSKKLKLDSTTPRSGEDKSTNKKSVSWKLDESLVQRLKNDAKGSNLSITEKVENIIKMYLDGSLNQ